MYTVGNNASDGCDFETEERLHTEVKQTSSQISFGKRPFFACYLLHSLNSKFKGRTYIGFTVNPARRIRQHNGEITSGAQRTRKSRPWEMVLVVHGFPSKAHALAFEWAWQNPLKSKIVQESALKLKSHSSVKGKLILLHTMLGLPHYSRLPLQVQFLSPKFVLLRRLCPPLPPQIISTVAPMKELPCFKNNGEDESDEEREVEDEEESRGEEGGHGLEVEETDVDLTRRIPMEFLEERRKPLRDIPNSPEVANRRLSHTIGSYFNCKKTKKSPKEKSERENISLIGPEKRRKAQGNKIMFCTNNEKGKSVFHWESSESEEEIATGLLQNKQSGSGDLSHVTNSNGFPRMQYQFQDRSKTTQRNDYKDAMLSDSDDDTLVPRNSWNANRIMENCGNFSDNLDSLDVNGVTKSGSSIIRGTGLQSLDISIPMSLVDFDTNRIILTSSTVVELGSSSSSESDSEGKPKKGLYSNTHNFGRSDKLGSKDFQGNRGSYCANPGYSGAFSEINQTADQVEAALADCTNVFHAKKRPSVDSKDSSVMGTALESLTNLESSQEDLFEFAPQNHTVTKEVHQKACTLEDQKIIICLSP